MITAKFKCDSENNTIRMKIRGHSGAAPKGEDLICCAVTTLAYTVAQVIQFMYEQGKLMVKPKIRIRNGHATIVATPTEEGYAEALHTFYVAQCGCHVLAGNYPKNVKLEPMEM